MAAVGMDAVTERDRSALVLPSVAETFSSMTTEDQRSSGSVRLATDLMNKESCFAEAWCWTCASSSLAYWMVGVVVVVVVVGAAAVLHEIRLAHVREMKEWMRQTQACASSS